MYLNYSNFIIFYIFFRAATRTLRVDKNKCYDMHYDISMLTGKGTHSNNRFVVVKLFYYKAGQKKVENTATAFLCR